MKWIHHTKGVSVDAQLSSEKQQQQARKRIALGKTVSSLLYLGCQGQSFRGHDDTDGNFMCLLQLWASDSDELFIFILVKFKCSQQVSE